MSETKLMPPIIEGVLPAFYNNKLTVPFQMNRAVSKNEFNSFSVKIKTVQNSRLIATDPTSTEIDWNNNLITFTFAGNRFRVGQYYKIQIAYSTSAGIIGHYSSVGTAKYTTEPTVYIEELNEDKNNFHQYTYTGVYSQKGKDTTEKLYSYRFNLYDLNYNLILTSGEKIHNSINDDFPYESKNNYVINKDLEQDQKYYLRYEITTINGMNYTSPFYPVMQKNSINPNFEFEVFADASDRENGTIQVFLQGVIDEESKSEKPVTGSFKLLRAGDNTNYTEWNEILDFNLYSQEPSRKLFTDFTIEHGVSYKYAVVQCSQFNLWSNKKESNIVHSDFEHAYLYDGERQLKIKFDPKVSSFKNTLLESKTDTIGSKHPFIFRNGNVSYKEFPISGLISLQMDEDNLFFNSNIFNEYERQVETTYNLVDVVNHDFYNYKDIWQELYIRKDGQWLSLKSYLNENKMTYEDGKNLGPYYMYSNDEQENPDKVTVYTTKYYSYQDYYKKLYIYRDNEYVLLTNYYFCYERTPERLKKEEFEKNRSQYYIKENGQYRKVTDTDEYSVSTIYYILTNDANKRYDKNEKYYLKSSKQVRKELNSYDTYSVDNVQAEREFKLEVLDWLNNGSLKLFRSPMEGNYIVRLMNSSLSPNDTLGRLLHTFSSTAYEMADNSFDIIKSSGFLKAEDPSETTLSWETVDIYEALYGKDIERRKNLIQYKAVALRFEGMLPGDRVYINDGIKRISGYENGNPIYQEGQYIVIGATGSYNIELDDNIKISAVSIDNVDNNQAVRHQGILTYAYYRTSFNKFDTIKDIEIDDVPLIQIVGPCKTKEEFLLNFNDIKHELQKIHFIHAKYIDREEQEYIRPSIYPKEDEFDSEGIIWVDEEPIYLKETREIFIKNPTSFNFHFGENVLVEICYQLSEITYDIEKFNSDEDSFYQKYKNPYEQAETTLNLKIYGTPKDKGYENLKQPLSYYQNEVKNKYQNFINELIKELEKQEAIEGETV